VRVVTADGRPVEGEVRLGTHEAGWHFTPRAAWAAGEYALDVQTILEDVCGNRVGRAFEVDESRPEDDGPPQFVKVPFTVKPPAP
jgi:hypothetical protein